MTIFYKQCILRIMCGIRLCCVPNPANNVLQLPLYSLLIYELNYVPQLKILWCINVQNLRCLQIIKTLTLWLRDDRFRQPWIPLAKMTNATIKLSYCDWTFHAFKLLRETWTEVRITCVRYPHVPLVILFCFALNHR